MACSRHNTPLSGHLERILPVLRRYRIRSASLFGSAARGQESETSDLDLLVDYPEGMTALKALCMKLELKEILNRPVDLVSRRTLKPHIRPSALAEQIRSL